MSMRVFGELDGVAVPEIVLREPGGLEAKIIGWGAALRDLVVPTEAGPRRVVLGLETLDDYVRYSPSFGAIPGRYANRIGGARFVLDGKIYQLLANEGPNQLHGGPDGFNRRIWSVLDRTQRSVELGLVSPAGDAGYPGRLVATCRYEIAAPMTLRITLTAQADAPTPVNLTNHAYYNLDGSDDVRDHHVKVSAHFFTPTGPGDIPTGAIAPVEGSPFDFRAERALRGAEPYTDTDINFVLRRTRESSPRLAETELAHAVTVTSPLSGLALELWTSEPGLQLYDGYKLDLPVAGHDGRRYGPYAGLALEPQRFPDGPNRSHFPSCILRPGETSRQTSEIHFRPA